MDYFYDVDLNFLNKYYSSYEWEERDCVKTIKKIPVFCISFNDFSKLITHKIKVDSLFLEKIKNKTKLSTGFIKYGAIFTDSNNSIAILFNDFGESVFFSSLKYYDELEMENIFYKTKKTDFNYEILNKFENDKTLRKYNSVKEFITKHIDDLIKTKNSDFLNFISYELFNESFTNEEKFLEKISVRLEAVDERLYEFYNLLKIPYKKV